MNVGIPGQRDDDPLAAIDRRADQDDRLEDEWDRERQEGEDLAPK